MASDILERLMDRRHDGAHFMRQDAASEIRALRQQLATSQAEAYERAAKVADEAAAMRERLFEENGASINASKAVQAEDIARAIRALAGKEG